VTAMKADMWSHVDWVELNGTTDTELKAQYDDLLKRSGFTILNFVDHFFSPHGYTALWLLGESHFAIHTFPEENKYYIELSSCIEEKYDNFKQLLL